MAQLSEEIPHEFITHLYTNYNSKDIETVATLFGQHSKIIYGGTTYSNLEEIGEFYTSFFESLKKVEPTQMVFLPSGSRGFRIHLKGHIQLLDDSETTFSESIVIRESNKKKDKSIWVESIITMFD
tara:strand:+ start:4106 stop:4483 length:378 start_codon:yes stop_codon:yes gene_type:complete